MPVLTIHDIWSAKSLLNPAARDAWKMPTVKCVFMDCYKPSMPSRHVKWEVCQRKYSIININHIENALQLLFVRRFFLNSFAIFKYFTKILLSSSNIISWIDAIFSIKRIFVVIEMDFPIVTPFKLFIRPTIHSMPRLFSINFVNCLNSIERSRFLYAFYWIQLGSSTLFEWKARSFSH